MFLHVDSGGKWPLPQQCCSLDLGFANAGGNYILDDARTWISLLRIATYPYVGGGIGLCTAKISSPQNLGPSCEVNSCVIPSFLSTTDKFTSRYHSFPDFLQSASY